MYFLYPFFISFILVFVSELGDKTQLLVLSFSSKIKTFSILIGVAIGSFFSHGIAILFGSAIGNLDNPILHMVLSFITYISFIFFGILSFFNNESECKTGSKGITKIISNLKLGYILIIAISIVVGELGDKTFLASLGLGIEYANCKIPLILGAIMGMVISDFLAILLGKFLSNKISEKSMNIISGIIFLFFGCFGFVNVLIHCL